MSGFVSGADERRRHRRKQLRKEKQAQSKDLPNAVLLIPPSNNHTQVLKLNTLAASLQEPQESFLAAFRKRLYRMTIVPSTNLTPDDVLFQTYLMLIFHESHTAFWSHLVFMQMVIVIGMIVLHPFLIALYCAYVWTLNRISLTTFLNWAFLFTITCSDILQGREVVALLAISWARLTLTTHRYEWAACTAAHLSLLHAVAATELVRAFVLNHPLVLLPVLGLFISLSHYYEPLPPRSTRDPNWIHFSDFVAKYGLVAAFVDVGFSCSVVGVVQEVVASFRVLPVFVAKAMLYSGLYDDPQLSRLDELCKLVTSTKFQSLDFIGLRPDQVAPLSIEEIDTLCSMGPQERVANFRRIISEYCERLSFIKSPDATKALEDFSSALEGYLVDPLFWADVEPLPEPCESVPPTSLSVLPAWSSL